MSKKNIEQQIWLVVEAGKLWEKKKKVTSQRWKGGGSSVREPLEIINSIDEE